MNPSYHHTQTGYLLIVALGAPLLFFVALMMGNGFNWAGLPVIIILALCLVLFATLTVAIDGETLTLHFGPGLIRKRFPLDDITAFRVVKNPWYYGWGIHLTPAGWLYNVSGFWAVEVQLKNGRKYRIGTDDPQGLAEAIATAMKR